MRRRAVSLAALAALALSGCLGGDDEGGTAPPAKGAPKAVAELVTALDGATQRREWRRICRDLLSASARRRAGGRTCARLLRESAGDLSRPRIELVSITFRGRRRATARVRSRARGQTAIEDRLDLVRERGRYRIDALAG